MRNLLKGWAVGAVLAAVALAGCGGGGGAGDAGGAGGGGGASAAPVIVTQPAAASVVAPATATFDVVATGTPAPAYRWQLSTDAGASYADIAGAVASSYALPTSSAADNGHRFRVIVANAAGSVTSDAATLTVSAAGNGIVVLHTFARTDGYYPINQLVEGSDGNFYGATLFGGASSFGTLFRMTPAGAVTTLRSFDVNSGFSSRSALVQGPDGAFYGASKGGGANAKGYVFRLQTDGAFTILHSFSGMDGMAPVDAGALAVGPDGNLYGATLYGGSDNVGTIYRISTAGAFTSLHSFVLSRTSGYAPAAGLLLGHDGAFYGTTSTAGDQSAPHTGSGTAAGTVFRMTAAGDVTILHTFFAGGTTGDLGNPNAALVQAGDGTLYGTAQSTAGVFRIAPDGSGYAIVTTFDAANRTDFPRQLVLATDGNFYFTTDDATLTDQYGKIYRVTPAGATSVVWSFDQAVADTPLAALMQARNGSLYGTTQNCAGTPTSVCRTTGGTVFRLDLGLPAK